LLRQVPRGGEDPPDLGTGCTPPGRGQAWLPGTSGCGGAVAILEDPVDPHQELAVPHAVRVGAPDPNIGAAGPLAATTGSATAKGPFATGQPITVGSGVPLTLWACGSAMPWTSATS